MLRFLGWNKRVSSSVENSAGVIFRSRIDRLIDGQSHPQRSCLVDVSIGFVTSERRIMQKPVMHQSMRMP
ncbi:MAG: hypothetical protein EBY46_02525 [Rhodobacteraceae bacterium]|nr:hypothetical protein [Paracoccaceae bacterium]